MRALTVLLLALLCACAPSYRFRVDPRFEPIEVRGIEKAVYTWNVLPGFRHRITLDTKGNWQVLKEEGPKSKQDDGMPIDYDWNGECSRSKRTVWIHPQSSEDEYPVMLHELGHAVGMKHTTTGVMMAYTVSVEFTPEVMAECKRVGACR